MHENSKYQQGFAQKDLLLPCSLEFDGKDNRNLSNGNMKVRYAE